MSTKYTIEDVRHLIPEVLTPTQEEGIVTYLNTGKVPPADPCLSCEPNLIRKYISRIQAEERLGNWPVRNRVELKNEFIPAQETETPKPKSRAKGK